MASGCRRESAWRPLNPQLSLLLIDHELNQGLRFSKVHHLPVLFACRSCRVCACGLCSLACCLLPSLLGWPAVFLVASRVWTYHARYRSRTNLASIPPSAAQDLRRMGHCTLTFQLRVGDFHPYSRTRLRARQRLSHGESVEIARNNGARKGPNQRPRAQIGRFEASRDPAADRRRMMLRLTIPTTRISS